MAATQWSVKPSREYLWVLARKPALAPADETAIRSRLVQAGFDLGLWQSHPHGQSVLSTDKAAALDVPSPTAAPAVAAAPFESRPAASPYLAVSAAPGR